MNKLYYVTLVIILTAKYMYRWKGIVLLCVCVSVHKICGKLRTFAAQTIKIAITLHVHYYVHVRM